MCSSRSLPTSWRIVSPDAAAWMRWVDKNHGVALPSHKRTDDRHAGRAGDVLSPRELGCKVHLRQRLLHVLSGLLRGQRSPAGVHALAQIGPLGCNFAPSAGAGLSEIHIHANAFAAIGRRLYIGLAARHIAWHRER